MMLQQPFSPPVGSLRSAGRERVRLMGLVSLDGEDGSRVVVRDVSGQGFGFESPVRFRPGDPVSLRLGSFPALRATIAFSHGDAHGCRFVRPMDEVMLASILASGPFAAERPAIVPPPAVWRWPGWARLGLMAGISAIGWTAVRAGLHAALA